MSSAAGVNRTRGPVRRIYSEKRKGFDIEAAALAADLRSNLRIEAIEDLRILYRYDLEGVDDNVYAQARETIFSEPPLDRVSDESFPLVEGEKAFGVEYLPGQYDQRADSAAQCLQLLAPGCLPLVQTARIFVIKGAVDPDSWGRIKSYCINPVDSREASLGKPAGLGLGAPEPAPVPILTGFIALDRSGQERLLGELDLAMDISDLRFCQSYFRDEERRDPTETEIRMLDTYWSDHCRHTTFLTRIDKVDIAPGEFTDPVREAFDRYREARETVYGDEKKPHCLMDIAQMGMRQSRQQGGLDDLEVSGEINACSIEVEAEIDGRKEPWLVMFKNETHNHPTEIEPFGGAATCLGGAIRDPLSGRSWVYQAMRVTGSGDPRTPVAKTLPGKLPQRTITREAARGYSSYGNQIGLATGLVAEIYDEGYVAKRMEIGAVIAAAPRATVLRLSPEPGDRILLVGGATGRDGIGGATGSSKAHTESSLLTCGAQVQKGNPVTERKIQRLFRNPEAACLIKRCNDFGAGGVAVAVGELADGIEVDLDRVPLKYEGLNGTELALSESQERMAVVVAAESVEPFRLLAEAENLEVAEIARVTTRTRLKMIWRGATILDLARSFLDSSGVTRRASVAVTAPAADHPFQRVPAAVTAALPDLVAAWKENLQDLSVCGQRGLVEQFDASIGRGSVLFPFGGRYQSTPSEGMAAFLPVLRGTTETTTVMTFGFDPRISRWSPFHGGVYAVVEAVVKMAACGAPIDRVRLSLQEYFEKPGRDPERWGKPFAALLGAYAAQSQLGIAAIGGKDSMSGSFKDLDVPPTLAAFAVAVTRGRKILSPEFKRVGSAVVLLSISRDRSLMPDFAGLKRTCARIHELAGESTLLGAATIRAGGLAATISRMAFGNGIGFVLEEKLASSDLFVAGFASLVVEIDAAADPSKVFAGIPHRVLGHTQKAPSLRVNGIDIDLDTARAWWGEPLETVFPTRTKTAVPMVSLAGRTLTASPLARVKIAKPRVLIPVFPGNNCEYDTERAFIAAGGIPESLLFRNLKPAWIEESIVAIAQRLKNVQILMIPGGFSAGDEPEGSGKFITAVFRNPRVQEAIAGFLDRSDGLILGVCNGFQALIKLGLIPDGRIRPLEERSPTLTFNSLGRHVSRIARTRVVSTMSPWFSLSRVGDIHLVPLSHGEGRLIAPPDILESIFGNGQVATQYVDFDGQPEIAIEHNPNGSHAAVEAMTSPDGRILGKMGHAERYAPGLFKNIPEMVEQPIFRSGIHYFS